MLFYQVDNLHAIIARLNEIKTLEKQYALTLSNLCDAGECALKENTEIAYNIFMDECGYAFSEMDIEM